MLRSWVLHHGDLLGFENIHVIDNSDDVRAVEYLRRSVSKYGMSVNFSTAGMMQLSDEMTKAALGMRSQCEFIFKLDTDEFLAVHNETDKSTMVDPHAFEEVMTSLPPHVEKFGIPFCQLMARQKTCDDPALATNHHAVTTGGPPKHFYNSKMLTSIDLGSHVGATSTASKILSSPLLILHMHMQCYEVYIRNLKKALISQKLLSATGTDSEHLAALDLIKNKVEWKSMANVHKAEAYYRYLQNPEEVKRLIIEQSQGYDQVVFTGLRDRVQKLMVKYGDY